MKPLEIYSLIKNKLAARRDLKERTVKFEVNLRNAITGRCYYAKIHAVKRFDSDLYDVTAREYSFNGGTPLVKKTTMNLQTFFEFHQNLA